MKREFDSRDEMIAYVQAQFPDAVMNSVVGELVGGRTAALARLNNLKLTRYDKTRNFLDGDVTMLSPYIRHGILTLAEVRDFALDQSAPAKFINELGWRDYWQRLYETMGNDIWEDVEPYKTGFTADQYAHDLPHDIATGETGTCIDLFIRELVETGYIHNHARMWLAAYVIHWRRVRWQAGAEWFLTHLLDGDPASNNLSWQWVASTFSHKPYFMNADNIRKFAGKTYPQLRKGKLQPFEGDYPQLSINLFPHMPVDEERYNKKRRKR